jgi:hypothetical protein
MAFVHEASFLAHYLSEEILSLIRYLEASFIAGLQPDAGAGTGGWGLTTRHFTKLGIEEIFDTGSERFELFNYPLIEVIGRV